MVTTNPPPPGPYQLQPCLLDGDSLSIRAVSLSRASFCSSANWDADWLSTPGLVGGVRLCWLHQCCRRLGLWGVGWGGGRSQKKGWKQKEGRKKTSDVRVQTHLLGGVPSSTSASTSSTSSSEHCASRWMWLGEEGESWDEEEEEEEDEGEEPL